MIELFDNINNKLFAPPALVLVNQLWILSVQREINMFAQFKLKKKLLKFEKILNEF